MISGIFLVGSFAVLYALWFPEAEIVKSTKGRFNHAISSFTLLGMTKKVILLVIFLLGLVAFLYSALPLEMAFIAAGDVTLYFEVAAGFILLGRGAVLIDVLRRLFLKSTKASKTQDSRDHQLMCSNLSDSTGYEPSMCDEVRCVPPGEVPRD